MKIIVNAAKFKGQKAENYGNLDLYNSFKIRGSNEYVKTKQSTAGL